MTSDLMGQPLPAHLRMTAHQLWAHLEAAFEEYAAWLISLHLEGEDEALDRASPREFVEETRVKTKRPKRKAVNIHVARAGEEETRVSVRHPLLIPFRRTDDAEELTSCFDRTRYAIPKLRELFKCRLATPEFLHEWGVFQYSCGIVASAYFSRGDDLGPRRAGKAGGRPAHDKEKKWIALLLIRQLDKGRSRPDAELDIGKAIRAAIKGKPQGDEDRAWLQGLLNGHRDLKSTFRERNFPLSDVQAAVELPVEVPTVYGVVPEN